MMKMGGTGNNQMMTQSQIQAQQQQQKKYMMPGTAGAMGMGMQTRNTDQYDAGSSIDKKSMLRD